MPDKEKRSSVGCGVLFGAIFALAGAFFLFLIGSTIYRALEQAVTWERVPCEITRCEVAIDPSEESQPFTLELEYRYRFAGRTFVGDRYRTSGSGSDDYTELARLVRALVEANPGAVEALVDPEEPAEAVLRREPIGFLPLFALLPAVFVAIGIGVILVSIRGSRDADRGTSRTRGMTTAARRKGGVALIYGFFALFFLVGLGVLYPVGIKPLAAAHAAKSWVATPCEILWSRVRRHRGSESDTYSVDVFYAYQFAGRTYRSNRFDFAGGASSGRASKEAVVAQYGDGETSECWVDPDDPFEAVLHRGFGAGMLVVVVPILFMLVGAGGMAGVWFARQKTTPSAAGTGRPGAGRDPGVPPRVDAVFRPGGKRSTAFCVALAIMLFWNGIVSVFLFNGGVEGWFGTLFMTPFVLVGLGLIAATAYCFLRLFNPKPEVTMTPASPRVGDSVAVSWRIGGAGGKLRRLQIHLVGTEEATYRRGTNTRTDRQEFCRIVLENADGRRRLAQGSGQATLPADLCPSVNLSNNAIKWKLCVTGEIPRWPDIADEYEIEIRGGHQ